MFLGTWDIPGPRIEPVSPALAGKFSTTRPPGKPPKMHFMMTCKRMVVFMKKVTWKSASLGLHAITFYPMGKHFPKQDLCVYQVMLFPTASALKTLCPCLASSLPFRNVIYQFCVYQK